MIFGFALSLISLEFTGLQSGISTSPGGQLSLDQSSFDLLIGLAVIGALLQLLVFVKLRHAFVRLRDVDDEFRGPSTFAIVAMVGLILIIPAIAALLSEIGSAIGCINSTPMGANPPPCVDPVTLLGLLGIIGIAAITLLIGYIGVLIGIYRVGTRYDQTTIKVGAVLLIIPFLNIIAGILILIGAREARRRIGSGFPGRPGTRYRSDF